MTIFFCTYLVRRGMQCSAAILPSMPTLANWSQNWSLSSSCSSLISSSSREATPLAVFGYFNKSQKQPVKVTFVKFITTTIFCIILALSCKTICTYEQQTYTKLDAGELKRVNMGSYCFKISISQTHYQNATFS